MRLPYDVPADITSNRRMSGALLGRSIVIPMLPVGPTIVTLAPGEIVKADTPKLASAMIDKAMTPVPKPGLFWLASPGANSIVAPPSPFASPIASRRVTVGLPLGST